MTDIRSFRTLRSVSGTGTALEIDIDPLSPLGRLGAAAHCESGSRSTVSSQGCFDRITQRRIVGSDAGLEEGQHLALAIDQYFGEDLRTVE